MKAIKGLKMKSADALGKMTAEDLTKEVKESEKQLYVMKMKKAAGEQKQTHLMKFLRRYIASLKTLLQAK